MTVAPPLPRRIAGIEVPQDDVSTAVWTWAHRTDARLRPDPDLLVAIGAAVGGMVTGVALIWLSRRRPA